MLGNLSKIAPAWRGVSVAAVACLASVERAFLPRYLSADRRGELPGAAAFLIGRAERSDRFVEPRAWVRFEDGSVGVMAADAKGSLWIASVSQTAVGGEGGSRTVWQFEIMGGPFRPDDDPTPMRQVDPRKAIRSRASAVSVVSMEAA